MGQKYYKKIHKTIPVYQIGKLPSGMNLTNMLRDFESKVPTHFCFDVGTFVVGDISNFTKEEYMTEGDTIYISSMHYCEEMLVENMILATSELIFNKLGGVNNMPFSKEFMNKRVDMFEDINETIHRRFALIDFIDFEVDMGYDRSMRSLSFEDLQEVSQKYFINYESSRSLRKYFCHLFFSNAEKTINRRKYSTFRKDLKKIEKTYKEKYRNEKRNNNR